MDAAARQDLHHALQRLAAGDRAAAPRVFSLALPVVQATAARMLARPEDADEAAQQALIKLFERASHFDPARGEALPWIVTLTVWECRAWRTRLARQRAREEQLPLPPVQAPSAAPSPEARALDTELGEAIAAALGHLLPADQETLAAALGWQERPAIPPGTFRQRLRRARLRLEQIWRQSYGEG